jgi:hypothetical protein
MSKKTRKREKAVKAVEKAMKKAVKKGVTPKTLEGAVEHAVEKIHKDKTEEAKPKSRSRPKKKLGNVPTDGYVVSR